VLLRTWAASCWLLRRGAVAAGRVAFSCLACSLVGACRSLSVSADWFGVRFSRWVTLFVARLGRVRPQLRQHSVLVMRTFFSSSRFVATAQPYAGGRKRRLASSRIRCCLVFARSPSVAVFAVMLFAWGVFGVVVSRLRAACRARDRGCGRLFVRCERLSYACP